MDFALSKALSGMRRECRHHEDALLFHHGRGFFVHQGGMLNRMDPGTYGIFHPRRPMGMGGDFPPGSLRFVHGGLKLFHSHLCLVR
jgi:hypothetical protein